MNKNPPSLKTADAQSWAIFKEAYWDYQHTAASSDKIIPMSQLVSPSVVRLVELLQVEATENFILTTEILLSTLNRQFRCQSKPLAIAKLKELRMKGESHSDCMSYIERFSLKRDDLEGGGERLPEDTLIETFIAGLEPLALRSICLEAEGKTLKDVQRLALTTVECHETQRKAVEFYYGNHMGGVRNSTQAKPTSCIRCGKTHSGQCTATCSYCHKVGHAEVMCRKKLSERQSLPQPASRAPTSTPFPSRASSSVPLGSPQKVQKHENSKDVKDAKDVQCFKCGTMGHYKSNCPDLR
jgi:hypothetical protein